MTPKIIVLENEPLLIRALVRALSRLDADVLQTRSEEEARKVLLEHDDAAVLVTDYYLDAGETSEGLLSWVRAAMPYCRRVLMSGQDIRSLDVDADLYDLFFPKPFSIVDFRRVIAEQATIHASLSSVA